SSRLPLSSGAKVDSPVMFPPGRARLATNPLLTGSVSFAMTMGIVVVASLAARVANVPVVTTTSTLRRTSSAASAGRRSFFPSAYRGSMRMFFPSTYPSSRRPCRNASMRAGVEEGKAETRYPILGTFIGCCASTGRLGVKSIAQRVSTVIFFFMPFALARSACYSTLDTCPFSLDDLIRSRQELWRKCQPNLLRCLQVNHKLKLGSLLHRQISRFGAFQD